VREIQILVVSPDRAPIDITTGVQALHNLLAHSMDWGSEFFTIEDLVPIRALERAAGWEAVEYGLDMCKHCPHDRSQHTFYLNGGCEDLCRNGLYWDNDEKKYKSELRCQCPGFELR
jgi:hypothetical protein